MLAVDDVSLPVQRGGPFSLLGPSGAGKTPVLCMIAGFETLDEGTIRIDGASSLIEISDLFMHPTGFQSLAPYYAGSSTVGIRVMQAVVRLSRHAVVLVRRGPLGVIRIVGQRRREGNEVVWGSFG